MKKLQWLLIATPLALTAAGCFDGSDGRGTAGELGEGTFSYECELSAGDAVCNMTNAVDAQTLASDLGSDGELPHAVAVGGRFDLHYYGDVTTDDFDRLTLHMVAAKKDHVSDQGGFIIDKEGRYAFMARDASEGIVADFVYLEAHDVADLDLWKDELRVTDFSFAVGDETHVAVVPIDADGRGLAGALAYEWSSSDEAIAVVDAASAMGAPTGGVEINDDEVRIVALAEGTATITVKWQDMTKDIAITVTPGVTP